MTVFIIHQSHPCIVLQVCQCQMTVLLIGKMKYITFFIIVHHMFLVIQTTIIRLRLIERKVYIMGEITEDVFQIFIQSHCHTGVCLCGQLGLYFHLHVCHQQKFIVQFIFVATIAQVVINRRTTCRQQQCQQHKLNFPQ